MNIEPKAITIEDLKESYMEGFSFFRKNALTYFLMWIPLFIAMYVTTEVKILVFLLPVIAAITYYATFEMTCTLYVGYKGSLIDKLKISFIAGMKVARVFFKIEILWILIYMVMIFLPALNAFITREDINKTVSMLWMSFWSMLFVAYCFDPFSCLKQGCVSMFLGDSKDYSIVSHLYKKALSLNIRIVFRTLLISMLTIVILMFFPFLFPIVAVSCACISFFIFCKVFEPPQMKIQEKVKVENFNAVPDLT